MCINMKTEEIKIKEEKLIEMTSSFCKEKLDEDYEELCIKLIRKMGRKHDIPFKRGKLENWASGIIYVLGQINFLFDKSFEPYASASDICEFYGTKKSTASNKAREIRKMFNLGQFDEEFSTEYIRSQIPHFAMTPEGFIIPLK